MQFSVIKFLILLPFFALSFAEVSGASTELDLVRRVAVFPIKVPQDLSEAAEESWWKVREILTENKRFLVASKSFLIQRDVFQGREDLSPSDAIILGKLLDSHALVSTYLSDKTLKMRAYEAQFGRILWEHQIELLPSLPMAGQLAEASTKLILDFISSFPYQAYAMLDSIRGSVVYKDGDSQIVKIDIGMNSGAEVGDKAQFIRILSDSLKPLFFQNEAVQVFAEGSILKVDRGEALVRIERMSGTSKIKEGTLVVLPKEFNRLRESYALQNRMKVGLNSELISPEMSAVSQEVREKKPLYTSLSFIATLAMFLLLAF